MPSIQSARVGSDEHLADATATTDSEARARFASAAKILSGRWNLMMLAVIEERPRRFAELLSVLKGISPNVLSSKLRELEAAGVVERRHLPLPANCWVYQISDGSGRLKAVLTAMTAWVDVLPTVA